MFINGKHDIYRERSFDLMLLIKIQKLIFNKDKFLKSEKTQDKIEFFMRLKNNNRNGYDEKYMKIKINSNNGLPFEKH